MNYLSLPKFLKIRSFFLQEAVFFKQNFTKTFKFVKRSFEDLARFKEQAEEMSSYLNCSIYFEGEQNYISGVPFFGFTALFDTFYILYMIHEDIFYTGNANYFFVNSIRVNLNNEKEFVCYDFFRNKVFTELMNISFLLCKCTNFIEVKDTRYHKYLMGINNINNQIFFHDDSEENVDKYTKLI